MKINKIIMIATIASLLFSQVVYAARLGGGRSRGMQRSIPTYQYNKNYNNTQQNYKPNNQQNISPQRGGISPGAAALMGAAAGAAGGYMLGKSSANNEAQDNMQNNQNMQESHSNVNNQLVSNPSNYSNINNDKSQMPWGVILILLVILLIGIAFFRKKTILPNNTMPDNRYPNNNYNNVNDNFEYNNRISSNMGSQLNVVNNESVKLADGIEREFFLRQAKGMFLHIQSMNNKENVSEIAKYLTPELYQSVVDEIQNNEFVADFNNLECELIDSRLESQGLFASVRFNGMVSESPNKTPESFSEVWHFLKKDINVNKWIVAGIQQVNS